MDKKHTSELLEQFQYNLRNRRKDLYEDMDYRDEIDEMNIILNGLNKQEIDKIDNILKSLKKY